jgi:DNA-binding transcriptional MerR regulator
MHNNMPPVPINAHACAHLINDAGLCSLAQDQAYPGVSMTKATEAFRTISEVATELEVPKHVLRFWEAKFPQIRPMKRGGGRRYYRPEDLELLRGIRHLLHAEGYTIKGVQKILREHGIDQVKAFADKAAKLEAEAPKAKRGRRALQSTGQTSETTLPRTPSGSSSPAKRTASSTALSPAQYQDIIDALIAELELCRRMLMTSSATRTPEAAVRPADEPQRRRTAG